MRWLMVAIGIAAPSTTLAHITMTFPPPRTLNQKIGPCGQTGGRGGTVSAFEPGSVITVRWNETIQHPGHYRISFDTDGQDFSIPPDTTSDTGATDPNVVLDLIPDKTTMGYSQDITLPNVTCTSCTLQLIQLMTDKPPYTGAGGDDIYFQCADITLMVGAPDAGPPPPDGPGGGPGGGGGPGADAGRGCSAAPPSSAGALLLALGLLARRRRRRPADLRISREPRAEPAGGHRHHSGPYRRS